MTDQNRDDSGQFASAEPIYGRAAELERAGLTELPDNREKKEPGEPVGSDVTSLRDLAGTLDKPKDDLIVREYLDDDGKPAPKDAAITLERAADDLSAINRAEAQAAEDSSLRSLAAEVDEMRAKVIGDDPDAAKHYGIKLDEVTPKSGPHSEQELSAARIDFATKLPQVLKALEGSRDAAFPDVKTPDDVAGLDADRKADWDVRQEKINAIKQEMAKAEDAPASDGIDPKIAEAMKHPQVAQAINEKFEAAEAQHKTYSEALGSALNLTAAVFLDQFPDLLNMSPDQRSAAVQTMAHQNPQRYTALCNQIARANALVEHTTRESKRIAEVHQKEFESYAKAEDARFDAMVNDLPKEQVSKIAKEIMVAAQEYGVTQEEFGRLLQTDRTMRSAPFQKMMFDAAQYRLLKKAIPVAMPKPIPQVQKPGVAQRISGDSVKVSELDARFRKNPSVKNAAALYNAKKFVTR